MLATPTVARWQASGTTVSVTVTTSGGGGNSITNGGFETGTFSGWTTSGTTSISRTAHRDNTTGTTRTILARTCTNNNTWVKVTASVTAGHSYTLTLTSRDTSYSIGV